ncbi:hypothetical protein C8R45DRAFT_1103163 [Mycena sanguinolenta]|nr:hypothetical protein C8R45DRAFT_1103163 [Mycena sanguinolenta]
MTLITIIDLESFIFEDCIDLILFSQFLDSFQHSAVLTAYINWYTNADWWRSIVSPWLLRLWATLNGIPSVIPVSVSADAITYQYERRYNSRDVFGSLLHLNKSNRSSASWLAQANCILKRLKIVSNYEDYKFVESVGFLLSISKTTYNPPDGYLIWSLDPSGNNPLSDKEALSLGFPSLALRTTVDVTFWDDSVYVGLRKFDECKAFNPESEDLAKELGYPLFESVSQATTRRDLTHKDDYSSSYSEAESTTVGAVFQAWGLRNIDDLLEPESDSDLASSDIEELTIEHGVFFPKCRWKRLFKLVSQPN